MNAKTDSRFNFSTGRRKGEPSIKAEASPLPTDLSSRAPESARAINGAGSLPVVTHIFGGESDDHRIERIQQWVSDSSHWLPRQKKAPQLRIVMSYNDVRYLIGVAKRGANR